MNSIVEFIKKNYKTINITILCICIYFLFIYPLISTILEKFFPSLTKCSYLQLTGKPCPLCGGTRFLRNIKNVFYDTTYVFNFFGLIILIFIIETIFRIINIKRKENRRKVIGFDIIIHCLLFICYLIYVIYYIINN